MRKLELCDESHLGACGNVLFHGFIPAPASDERDRILNLLSPSHNANSDVDDNSVDPHNVAPLVTSEPSSSDSSTEMACSNLDTTTSATPSVCLSGTPINQSSANDVAVVMIRCQQSWVAVAYRRRVCLYRLKEAVGWQLVWRSPHLPDGVDRVALNGKQASSERLLAVASAQSLWLWSVRDGVAPSSQRVGEFPLRVPADDLLFIGGQLVAVSRETGRIGVWHGTTGNWQSQAVPAAVTSLDVAGSEFLLLGCLNGSIYYIDMQKFPLRMKDNDLLVTELYRDPKADPVTALSVYVTPKTCECYDTVGYIFCSLRLRSRFNIL